MNSLIIRVQTSVAGKQRKKSFFYDSLSTLQQMSLKKSDKKPSFVFNWLYTDLATMFIQCTCNIVFKKFDHPRNHIGISSKRFSFENTGQSSFFFWRKEWLWGCVCCFFCCYQKGAHLTANSSYTSMTKNKNLIQNNSN